MLNYFNNIKNVPEILQENFSDLRYIMKIPTASQQDEIRKIMEANPEVFYSLNIRHATMSDVYDENIVGGKLIMLKLLQIKIKLFLGIILQYFSLLYLSYSFAYIRNSYG